MDRSTEEPHLQRGTEKQFKILGIMGLWQPVSIKITKASVMWSVLVCVRLFVPAKNMFNIQNYLVTQDKHLRFEDLNQHIRS